MGELRRTRVFLAAVGMVLTGGCVSLRVVDGRTGRPIAGAEVTWSGYFGETVVRVGGTDKKGHISFMEPDGMDMLTVSMPGYQTWECSHARLMEQVSVEIGRVEVRLRPKWGPGKSAAPGDLEDWDFDGRR